MSTEAQAPTRDVPAPLAATSTDRRDLIGLALLALAAVALPLVVGQYSVRLATTVLMYVALAQAWNLVGGYAGLLSIAHPAFFGTGAVAAAIVLINGLPLILAVVVAAAVAVGIAGLTGLPTLRLRGHYFVIASFLISEVTRNAVLNIDAFGYNGGVAANIFRFVPMIPGVAHGDLLYFVMLALALSCMGLVIAVDRSRWGYALRAIRDNESAARALGIHAPRVRLLTFLLSALLTAFIGTAWALWLGVVDTNEAYNPAITFEVIVMVFLGGMGTVWGPPLGVLLILLLGEYFGIKFAELTLVTSGLIVALIVLFLPEGLVRVFTEGPRGLHPARLAQNLRRFKVR
ncbi:MAG: branched-chain amino acid ABC transporter permease [Gemmatimonadales bacterium]